MGFNDIIIEKLDEIDIDTILRSLIEDSDLEEVVSVLDIIAQETENKNIQMFDEDDVRCYPVQQSDR
ncbi:hypothetical protein DRH29_04200 [candidate division Kazan bacterium]|uniref:Uncharacterized protein n=1 Tax=candidate division Kazan bacterium TaxID=2202143 RepID=A0A420ZBW5_UNCK3|nr:MAG: hypothetical protein DRH29_04200 [candidate division Kazan bacterium]